MSLKQYNLLRLLYLLFPVFLLLACSDDELVDTDVLEEPEVSVPVDSLTYLALGDSYTIGSGVDKEDRFPIQLASRLTQDSFAMREPRFIATQGWTTVSLAQALTEQNIPDSFDLVSLLIGVNNQFQGRPFEDYEGEFSSLLESAIRFAGGRKDRVIVLSIPDYAYTPFGQSRPNPDLISEEIDAYNEVNKRVALEKGVAYFDITPISRRGLMEEDLVAVDGLHPSGKMYGEWIDLMIDTVKELLDN